MLKTGQQVRNVRRPNSIGVVVSLNTPNNDWYVNPDFHRVVIRYDQIKLMSDGTWEGGTLDELPIDLLPVGENIHEAFTKHVRSGDVGGTTKNGSANRILMLQRKRK
jgi:hypothetical protein